MKDLWTPRLWIPPAAPDPDRLLRDLLGAGYLVPPTKNPGDALTSALWNSYIRDNLDFGMVRPIADTVLGSGAAAVDMLSIPATFAHLLIEYDLRCDGASDPYGITLRFNGDSGANYNSQLIDGATASVTASTVAAGLWGEGGIIPGATATASRSAKGQIVIPNYATGAVFHRGWVAQGGFYSANARLRHTAGSWSSTAAINRVTIGNTGGNLITGSRVTLYGMGGI